ncbi:hypothetical protein [Budvicia aquatica]|uniref:Uncharacterized protein n=1 Tax=Budvicia aquatica TaxID=82979 RepID=A0A2C6DQU1_9GAMM|nr:hypothetical protein [Budvicia aquatica]PHI31181.1 hypothetical protein CRN84_18460 [Budvicia aquatica]VFS51440.1 Uncharacterised protein [Budvicia aquatica]
MKIEYIIEQIASISKKTPEITKTISAVISKLSSYTVINGLVYFFVARADCKFPGLGMKFVGPVIAFLFLVFLLDVFTNDFTLFKIIDNKEGTILKRIIVIFLAFLAAGLLSWLYVSGIYQPLFSIPDKIWECKI